jgi:hypothetical protein
LDHGPCSLWFLPTHSAWPRGALRAGRLCPGGWLKATPQRRIRTFPRSASRGGSLLCGNLGRLVIYVGAVYLYHCLSVSLSVSLFISLCGVYVAGPYCRGSRWVAVMCARPAHVFFSFFFAYVRISAFIALGVGRRVARSGGRRTMGSTRMASKIFWNRLLLQTFLDPREVFDPACASF